MEKIKAPWTNEQVEKLNEYQTKGHFHPFTCGNNKHEESKILVATNKGWECPACKEWNQTWAWDFMFKGAVDSFAHLKRSCPSSNHDKEEE